MEVLLSSYGYGYGSGSGSGDGYGETIASVGDHGVHVVREFNVVRVGCQVHTIEGWKRSWREIAEDHSVNITQAKVDGLLALAEAR